MDDSKQLNAGANDDQALSLTTSTTQQQRQPQIISPSFSYSPTYSFLSSDGTPHSPTSSYSSYDGLDDDGLFPLHSYSSNRSSYSSRPDSPLNLGVESPGSILNPATTPNRSLTPSTQKWQDSGIAVVHTDVPIRSRLWRSASFQKKKETARKLEMDEGIDCGICFEPPTNPRKMSCCGSVFCLEHISSWLYGVSSDGCCPTCKKNFFAPSRPSSPRLRTPDTHPPPYHSPQKKKTSNDSDELSATVMSTKQVGDISADNYVYERIISLVGLTLVLLVLLGWV